MADEQPSLSRKRTREEDDAGAPAGVTDLSLDDDKQQNAPKQEFPAIKSLLLEAIFHPKFENENQNDQSIRSQMKQRVLEGKGYIEVSLKHSGSLLLWSGGQRYYSKNSTENPFTYVGEVLLRQHFYRAFSNDGEDHESLSATSSLEKHYQECSDYVQENRLTLAFEVVTAILGHHGDIPKRDFLILTAVADRNSERFYSSTELVEFCQRFRLPHNDMWVFCSQESVDGLFHLYDTTRETGLATDTVEALNGVADIHVSSMYPHTVFQGNILEGIVIRYVPYHNETKERDVMRGLAAESERILQAVPPETPPSFVLTRKLAAEDTTPPPPVLATDIRELSRNAMATGDREQVSAFLQTSIHDILCSRDKIRRQGVNRTMASTSWTNDFGATLRQALSSREDLDTESQRILKLIETLDSLNAKVNYRIVKETTYGQPDRWLCIVHVFFDTTHQKFRRKMEPNDMNLFRGFCIELGTEPKGDKMKIDTVTTVNENDDASGLMLKMKLLPYMVRTFGCRNGLDVVEKRGPQAFTEYAMKLMTKWGMSSEAKAKWQPFFSAWGKYAHLCFTDEKHEYSNAALPKLCDTYYLDHLEHFITLYENGKIVGDLEEQSSGTFRGLIFVVGLDREKADLAAEKISERLGGLIVRNGLSSLSPEDWDAACLARKVGIVCSVIATEKASNVRKKLQSFGDAMFAVLVGCDELSMAVHCAKKETTKSDEPEPDTKSKKSGKKSPEKMLRGMVGTWRKTHFAKLWEISDSDLFDESTLENDQEESSAISPLVEELEDASAALPKIDERPGLLVFFAGIPGSGKSTLCSKDAEENLRNTIKNLEEESKASDSTTPRPVIVRVSDEVKQKYWPLVKIERTKFPSSVYIADKNAPPAGWPKVAEMCSIHDGTAVPVLPDKAALQTTSVTGAGVYPFSLQYLAVCIARVAARPPTSHSGKLDRSTGLACMIVVKFFSLYRGIAHEELLPSIQRAIERGGARMAANPITVPFFEQEALPELPPDLQEALIDAIRIQYEYDVIRNDDKMSRDDERVAEIETRLRTLVEKHSAFLMGLSADPAVSKESFVSQLLHQVSALPSSATLLDSAPSAADQVKIASVDVKQACVHSVLKGIADKSPVVSDLLAKWSNQATTDDTVIPGENFVSDTHVTMVHCSQMSQNAIRDAFEPLVGCEVQVEVTGVLWNDDICALAVKVAPNVTNKPDLQVPPPKNDFAHITVWHQPEISAAHSNELPSLVESGNAKRLVFDETVVLQGIVSLWDEDRASS